jgi:hypothetical protein
MISFVNGPQLAKPEKRRSSRRDLIITLNAQVFHYPTEHSFMTQSDSASQGTARAGGS